MKQRTMMTVALTASALALAGAGASMAEAASITPAQNVTGGIFQLARGSGTSGKATNPNE